MNFQQLKYHFEDNGCEVDHYLDEGYMVSNIRAGRECLVENLDEYVSSAIVHYCLVLGIPAPSGYSDLMEAYRNAIHNAMEFID